MSNGLRVISCLSALNVRVAGTQLDRNSVTDVEIWPEGRERQRRCVLNGNVELGRGTSVGVWQLDGN